MKLPDRDEGAARRLRVGLVLDSYGSSNNNNHRHNNNVSAWVARAIDDLMSAEFIEVSVVVRLQSGREAPGNSWGSWLFRRYAEWDARRGGMADDPLAKMDVASRLAGIPAVEGMADASLDALREYDLDVLIWWASAEPALPVRKAARSGVWLYRPRQKENFWELYEQNPVSRSALEAWREETGGPRIMYEGFSATEQGWSWRQNQKVPSWRAATFGLRGLRELQQNSEGRLGGTAERTMSARAGESPTNLQMIAFLLRNAARTVSRRARYAQKESHWFVAYRTGRERFVAVREEFELTGFQMIRAPEGHFYADPFVIQWQGQNYLFVEDYLFSERRGCISVLEIGAHGVTGEAERVLDLPYHLSYPFVFEHEGGLYMIPETLGAGRIELYRAVDGPLRWELVKVLRDGVQAVDTTLWIEDGKFYFFTNVAERGATVNDELFLFYADKLLGEWKSHPANPVVTDVRRSRGAGKLFRRKGKLIRPAQDCSVRYGYACELNEIEVLTPAEYRERPVRRIEPDWAPGLIGTHTINSNEEIEVIDGQVYGKSYPVKG